VEDVADSGPEAGRRPRTVLVAGGLIFAVSALMVVWGACTLSRAGEFGAAAYRFSASHQDVDIAPGFFELAFVMGAVISLVFGLMFLLLGLLNGRRGSRVVTWLVSCAALPFVYATYNDYGASYMFPGTASSAAPMRILTPWRFAGWYHRMTVGFGILIIAGLVAVIVLLALPASRRYYRDLVKVGAGNTRGRAAAALVCGVWLRYARAR
jgi:hypothetical protein